MDSHCLYLKCIRSSCQLLSRSLFRADLPAWALCVRVHQRVQKSDLLWQHECLIMCIAYSFSTGKSPSKWKAEMRFIPCYQHSLTCSHCFFFKLYYFLSFSPPALSKLQHYITKSSSVGYVLKASPSLIPTKHHTNYFFLTYVGCQSFSVSTALLVLQAFTLKENYY